MKILHINDHYARVGGAETILFQSIAMLRRNGIENVVVHQHPVSNPPETEKAYQIDHLGEVFQKDSAPMDRLQKILKDEKPDLVHVYDIGNPPVVKKCNQFAPTLQSAFNHSFYCPGGQKFLPFLNRPCERSFGAGCLASAFLTHCNSVRPHELARTFLLTHGMLKKNSFPYLLLGQYQARWFQENGIPPERLLMLPPAIPQPPESEIHPEMCDAKNILFVGRIMPQKGLDRLLEALSLVKSPFRLTVNGDGVDLQKAKSLAAKLGLTDRVEFAGWTSRKILIEHYQRASFVVMPSIWPEPFGLVGPEAMGYGKPTIAFRTGGIVDWLKDGLNGFLVTPFEVMEMAQRIEYFLQHPEKARAMGKSGRQFIAENYNEAQYEKRLLEYYKKTILNWKKETAL